mmetsp:Transcript_90887/g.257436  ORF Transcript_90887/g.257436 Transcript_90887/m.257436 type:complete len:318 (+) Transcript_90887:664-1617(+)
MRFSTLRVARLSGSVEPLRTPLATIPARCREVRGQLVLRSSLVLLFLKSEPHRRPMRQLSLLPLRASPQEALATSSAEFERTDVVCRRCLTEVMGLSLLSKDASGSCSSLRGDSALNQTWFRTRSCSLMGRPSSGFLCAFQGSRSSTSARQRLSNADLNESSNCPGSGVESRECGCTLHSRSSFRLAPQRRRSFSVTVICARLRPGMGGGLVSAALGSIRTVRSRCAVWSRWPSVAGVLTWHRTLPSLRTSLLGTSVHTRGVASGSPSSAPAWASSAPGLWASAASAARSSMVRSWPGLHFCSQARLRLSRCPVLSR